MRNTIIVTKCETPSLTRKCFLDLNRIIGIEIPEKTICIRLYLEKEVWYIPAKEFEYIISRWAPYYNNLNEYKELTKT